MEISKSGRFSSIFNSTGISLGYRQKKYSIDTNCFHRSCEGGELEDIQKEYSEKDVLEWIDRESRVDSIPITLGFENGKIVDLDGRSLKPNEIILELNKLGSKYGIGLCDIVEERMNGIKSRGIYETPGGTIAHEALKALKQICWSRELYLLAQTMSREFGLLVYDGYWYSDHCHALNAFFQGASEKLTGKINLLVGWRSLKILGRQSPFSLYQPDIVSFESDELDIHKASMGYSQILTLSAMIQGQREGVSL